MSLSLQPLNNMPKKIMIAFLGELYLSPRNTRFFNVCRERAHAIDVCCHGVKSNDLAGINRFVQLNTKNETVSWRLYSLILRAMRLVLPGHGLKNALNASLNDFSAFVEALKSNTYDLIYVSDVYLLPYSVRYKKKAKIMFDAREYYPLQNDESFFFRTLDSADRTRVCRKYLPLVDKMITVSYGIAKKYKEEFGVNAEVVMSAPYYQSKQPQNRSTSKIRILYHGMANRNRRIENMIHIFKTLMIPAELHFYMVGDQGYISELHEEAKNDSNIFFHEPVPPEKIVETINQYDIGFCFYEPTTFNVIHCLPNKFFEYIQARLVVAIGPSPEMAEIVRRYDCGLIGDTFDLADMTSMLNRITRDDINRIKDNSDKAAQDLCFENELIKLQKAVEALI